MVPLGVLAIATAAVTVLMIHGGGAKQLDSYVNCGGSGHIENITVVPCESEPCEFVKGTKVKVHFIGSFSRDSNSVRVRPSAILEKLNVTLPGVDLELCGKHVQCPIKANELRDAEIEVPVFNMYPNMRTEVAFLVFCDNELQFCVRTEIIVSGSK